MKSIFTLVGPAKVGKTTLVLKVADAIPDNVGIIKSTTTRSEWDEKDANSYIFLTKEEFEKKLGCGDFIEYVENEGQFYGFEKKIVDEALEKNMASAQRRKKA